MTDPHPPQRPAGGEPAGTAAGMPVPARVATGLLALLAVLLLVSAVLTWLGRDDVVDRFVAAQPGLDRAAVARYVQIGLVRDLAVGLVGAAAAAGLVRRRS